MKLQAVGRSAWRKFRSLPTWGQVVTGIVAVSLAVVPFGSDNEGSIVETRPSATQPPSEESSTTSTTAEATTTTSTTTASTTTTTTTSTTAPSTTTTAKPMTTTTAKRAAGTTTTTRKPASSASSRCHTSYTRTCIPPDVSDADCAGGSGNGPHYVYEEDIGVVGPDVFDLDRDGDGLGCDS